MLKATPFRLKFIEELQTYNGSPFLCSEVAKTYNVSWYKAKRCIDYAIENEYLVAINAFGHIFYQKATFLKTHT